MSWSITTAFKTRNRKSALRVWATLVVALAASCAAQELRVPQSVAAESEALVSTTGSGNASFYLVGPGVAKKEEVKLGEEIHLAPENLKYAGRYLAILCVSSCSSAQFFVTPAKPASLAFLVHPSRVPARQPDAVSGVALLFDKFDNLVLAPETVNFLVKGPSENLFSRAISTSDGDAWFRTSSGKSAGPVRLTASADDLSAQRVLQQVAADPCNLRIKAEQTAKGIEVETDPVRDCAGNPVADGTIVTFTGTDSTGKISIDAPIKGHVARALIDASEPVVISAACGVAMGNELRIGKKESGLSRPEEGKISQR
jgi:hypothetical protein